MNTEVQLKLNALMQNEGRVVLASPADLEARIRAEFGEGKDASLLLMALGAGVPQSLIADPTSAAALTQRLQDEYFMAPEPADAAVQAWATALGMNSGTLMVHNGPALPHVEVIEPPSMHQPPIVVQTALPVAPSSNGTAIALVVVAALVIIGLVGGYFVWRRSQDVAVVPQSDNRVVSLPQSSSTTGQIPIIPGGAKSKPTVQPVVGDNSGSGPDLNMAAYNAKLAEEHQMFDQAGENFKQANSAIPATADINDQMDQAAPIWDSYSQAIERVASDLEAITPPSDASAIHRRLADFIRQFSALVEVGAQAARDHDAPAFEENGNKLKDLGTSAGQELNSMITAAGYDLDQYSRDGTLVKRK